MTIDVPFEFGEKLFYIIKVYKKLGWGRLVIREGCLKGVNVRMVKNQLQIKGDNAIGINYVFKTRKEAELKLINLDDSSSYEGMPRGVDY